LLLGRSKTSGQTVCETPSQKKIARAKWTGCVVQTVVLALQAQNPEFKPQSQQKMKKKKLQKIYLIKDCYALYKKTS
jgi:hypothetical protein